MTQWNKTISRRKKATPFVPNRTEIESAMKEYLENGGKITKLEANDENYLNFIQSRSSPNLVDDFLFDR